MGEYAKSKIFGYNRKVDEKHDLVNSVYELEFEKIV